MIRTHEIIDAWEQFKGGDVTAFYAEWDAKIAASIQGTGDRPLIFVGFTVEDIAAMQEALDSYVNSTNISDDHRGADNMADELTAVLDKLKGATE